MKQNWTHKIIATIFIMVLMFPVVIHGLHILEDHEHSTCTSQFEENYHSEEANCSICDFQINNQAYFFTNDIVLESFNTITEQPLYNYTLKYSAYTQFSSSRAPPLLV